MSKTIQLTHTNHLGDLFSARFRPGAKNVLHTAVAQLEELGFKAVEISHYRGRNDLHETTVYNHYWDIGVRIKYDNCDSGVACCFTSTLCRTLHSRSAKIFDSFGQSVDILVLLEDLLYYTHNGIQNHFYLTNHQCHLCGKMLCRENACRDMTTGILLCRDCYRTAERTKCDCCGNDIITCAGWRFTSETNFAIYEYCYFKTNPNGVVLCLSCSQNNVYQCSCCRRSVYYPTRNEPHGFTTDKLMDCIIEIRECTDYEDEDNNTNYMIDMSYVCRACFNSGQYSIHNDHYYRSFREQCPCLCVANYNTRVNSHSFKPDPYFFCVRHGDDDLSNEFYGIELEIEAEKGAIISRVNEANGMLAGSEYLEKFFYVKRDGSLNFGAEVVSHPATFKFWMENKGLMNPILGLRRKKGYSSALCKTCGMHVHISRDVFSSQHMYNMLKLFECRRLMFAASRRDRDQFNSWCRTGLRSEQQMIRESEGRSGEYKYAALNTRPSRTVEVRIFRGTLDRQTFFGNLQFVKCAVDFTRGVEPDYVTPGNFVDYLYSQREQFHEMMKRMYSRVNKPSIRRTR